MNHIYDVDVAKAVGIKEAVLLYNIDFWIEKNRANEEHIYDGKCWTYNSIRAYTELFPEMSVQNIRTALKHLEEGGYIETGNFNKSAYDRTQWYTLTDKYYTICHRGQMDLLEPTNGSGETNKPIPYINTYKETNNICVSHKMNLYGENKNVLLSDEEYQKLVDKFGEKDARDKIDNLSFYLASTGKKYKSHYMTILNWARKETPAKPKTIEPPKYKRFEKEPEYKREQMTDEMRATMERLRKGMSV